MAWIVKGVKMKKFFNTVCILIVVCSWLFWLYQWSTEGLIIAGFLFVPLCLITWFFGGLAGIIGGKKQ
jgi:hypothetical protein